MPAQLSAREKPPPQKEQIRSRTKTWPGATGTPPPPLQLPVGSDPGAELARGDAQGSSELQGTLPMQHLVALGASPQVIARSSKEDFFPGQLPKIQEK